MRHSLKSAPGSKAHKLGGFTLIEFSLVMLISAGLMVSGMQFYQAYKKRVRQDTTYENLSTVNNLIAAAFSLENRYFCPADPTLSPDDPDFGRENCPTSDAIGFCTGGSSGVCVGAGVDTPYHLGTPDPVYIGMFPFRSILEAFETDIAIANSAYKTAPNLAAQEAALEILKAKTENARASSIQAAMDGWDNRMTYYVTGSMTKAASYNKNAGAISLLNELGEARVRSGVPYAIVSHGENGYGSYTYHGQMGISCADAMVSDIDKENCDMDGTVIAPIIRSYSSSANQADDMVEFAVELDSAWWGMGSCGAGVECIYNRNEGFVGVNIADSESVDESFQVNGVARASSFAADEICDANGICFSPELIAGTTMAVCDQTGAASDEAIVAVAIKFNKVICSSTPVKKSAPIKKGQYCPSGQYIVGFNSTGDIICKPMP